MKRETDTNKLNWAAIMRGRGQLAAQGRGTCRTCIRLRHTVVPTPKAHHTGTLLRKRIITHPLLYSLVSGCNALHEMQMTTTTCWASSLPSTTPACQPICMQSTCSGTQLPSHLGYASKGVSLSGRRTCSINRAASCCFALACLLLARTSCAAGQGAVPLVESWMG